MMSELKRQADQYLNECFEKQTSPQVNELAAKLETPVSKLSNDFRSAIGQRPSTYLKRQQVEYAKKLIRSTELDYATIARAAAYGTRNTLFRAFRRITGKTPDSYRRRKQKKPRHPPHRKR